MSTMGNYWAKQGWRVILLTTNPRGDSHLYELDPAIIRRHVHLQVEPNPGIWRRARNVLTRHRMLRQEILAPSPDFAISFLTMLNVRTVLAARGIWPPVVIPERSNPSVEPLPRAWQVLPRSTYPMAPCLVAQTQRVLSYFPAAVRRKGVCDSQPNGRSESPEWFVGGSGGEDRKEGYCHGPPGTGKAV